MSEINGNTLENQNPNQVIDNNLNLEQVKESFKLINNALNKSCTKGIFNLDEAYLIKISLNNLNNLIRNLDS